MFPAGMKWLREAAVTDLTYWENEVRVGRTWPSRAQLADRWGWTEYAVRCLLAEPDAWQDSRNPVPAAKLMGARDPRQHFIQVTAKSSPSNRQVGTDEPGQSADLHPSLIQVTAKSSPSRDLLSKPVNHMGEKPAGEDPGQPAAVTEAWSAIVDLAPHHQSRSGNPRKVQGEHLHARISEEGLDAVLAVVRYVHEKPHRDNFWGPTNDDPGSYLLPKWFPGLLGKARKAGCDRPAAMHRAPATPAATSPRRSLALDYGHAAADLWQRASSGNGPLSVPVDKRGPTPHGDAAYQAAVAKLGPFDVGKHSTYDAKRARRAEFAEVYADHLEPHLPEQAA